MAKTIMQMFGHLHCVKGVRIWCFSGPFFPAFGLNTERYEVSLRIESECGKIRTRKASNTDTFHAVLVSKKNYNYVLDLMHKTPILF